MACEMADYVARENSSLLISALADRKRKRFAGDKFKSRAMSAPDVFETELGLDADFNCQFGLNN